MISSYVVVAVMMGMFGFGFVGGLAYLLTVLRSYTVEEICQHITKGHVFKILINSKVYDSETGECIGRKLFNTGWFEG